MIVSFITAAAVIILDQITKYLVSSNMEINDSFVFIKNILNITYQTNKGAAFSILANHRWVFMILSSIALVAMAGAIIYLNRKKLKGNEFIKIALALMLGGGTGNMIDRVYAGYVVDFLEFDFVNFAIFNVADSFVCVGSVLLFICVFTGKYNIPDISFSKSGKSEKNLEIKKPEETEENKENKENEKNEENDAEI